jgi:hypothetical protein
MQILHHFSFQFLGQSLPANTYPNLIPDVQFYSQDYLSMSLLNKESNSSCFLQLSVGNCLAQAMKNKKFINLKDVTDPNSWKKWKRKWRKRKKI